eukprot:6726203-Prymnesium_polylepis.2
MGADSSACRTSNVLGEAGALDEHVRGDLCAAGKVHARLTDAGHLADEHSEPSARARNKVEVARRQHRPSRRKEELLEGSVADTDRCVRLAESLEYHICGHRLVNVPIYEEARRSAHHELFPPGQQRDRQSALLQRVPCALDGEGAVPQHRHGRTGEIRIGQVASVAPRHPPAEALLAGEPHVAASIDPARCRKQMGRLNAPLAALPVRVRDEQSAAISDGAPPCHRAPEQNVTAHAGARRIGAKVVEHLLPRGIRGQQLAVGCRRVSEQIAVAVALET